MLAKITRPEHIKITVNTLQSNYKGTGELLTTKNTKLFKKGFIKRF